MAITIRTSTGRESDAPCLIMNSSTSGANSASFILLKSPNPLRFSAIGLYVCVNTSKAANELTRKFVARPVVGCSPSWCCAEATSSSMSCIADEAVHQARPHGFRPGFSLRYPSTRFSSLCLASRSVSAAAAGAGAEAGGLTTAGFDAFAALRASALAAVSARCFATGPSRAELEAAACALSAAATFVSVKPLMKALSRSPGSTIACLARHLEF